MRFRLPFVLFCLLVSVGVEQGSGQAQDALKEQTVSSGCISEDQTSVGMITLPATASFVAPLSIDGDTAGAYTLLGLVADHLPDPDLRKKKERAIEHFLASRQVSALSPSTQKADRYGRRAVFVTAEREHRTSLLQDQLVRQGLARVSLDGLNEACARDLLEQERQARQRQLGLWKLPEYVVKNVNSLHLSAIVSTYQIVSGTVLSVHRRADGTSYLNFGKHWNKDFTVSLSEADLKSWEEGGKILDDLRNKPIYVRGWVEQRGGPLIRVTNALQLQDKTENALSGP
nr:thermonuclease family protein [uncultured Cohaesibacter sp.]